VNLTPFLQTANRATQDDGCREHGEGARLAGGDRRQRQDGQGYRRATCRAGRAEQVQQHAGGHEYARGGGGGGIIVNTNVRVDNSGNAQSSSTGDTQDPARQLGKIIETKVKEVLVTESRQGGQLWRMQHQ
jgi:hypothetical protein